MASTPELPIPLSYVQGRYLLFSITAVSYLRRQHNICGVLTGTLPQAPSQNIFLGLPLELMPEEAKLLVEEGVACVVDASARHSDIEKVPEAQSKAYLQELERQGREAARIQTDRKAERREQAMRRVAAARSSPASTPTDTNGTSLSQQVLDSEESLFEQPETSHSSNTSSTSISSSATLTSRNPVSTPDLAVTPATSDLLLPSPPPPQRRHQITGENSRINSNSHDINVPSTSYHVFKHLHSKSYFITPGLRFGCQYMVYPGDPLRFHSHFLVVAYDWEEEIDLMDLVGGGRLGTGVKKGFLIGGVEKNTDNDNPNNPNRMNWDGHGRLNGRAATGAAAEAEAEAEAEIDTIGEDSKVCTWSIEWARM